MKSDLKKKQSYPLDFQPVDVYLPQTGTTPKNITEETPRELSYFSDIFKSPKGLPSISISPGPKILPQASSNFIRLQPTSKSNVFKRTPTLNLNVPLGASLNVPSTTVRTERVRAFYPNSTLVDLSLQTSTPAFIIKTIDDQLLATTAIINSNVSEEQKTVARWKSEELNYIKANLNSYFSEEAKKTDQNTLKIKALDDRLLFQNNQIGQVLKELEEANSQKQDISDLLTQLNTYLSNKDIWEKDRQNLRDDNNSKIIQSYEEYSRKYIEFTRKAHSVTFDKLQKTIEDIDRSNLKDKEEKKKIWKKFSQYLIQSPDTMTVAEITRTIGIIQDNEREVENLEKSVVVLEQKLLDSVKKNNDLQKRMTDLVNEGIRYSLTIENLKEKNRNLTKNQPLLQQKDLELQAANEKVALLENTIRNERQNLVIIQDKMNETQKEMKDLKDLIQKVSKIDLKEGQNSQNQLKSIIQEERFSTSSALKDVVGVLQNVQQVLQNYTGSVSFLQTQLDNKQKEFDDLQQQFKSTNQTIPKATTQLTVAQQLQNLSEQEQNQLLRSLGITSQWEKKIQENEAKIAALESNQRTLVVKVRTIAGSLQIANAETKDIIDLINDIKNFYSNREVSLTNKTKTFVTNLVETLNTVQGISIENPRNQSSLDDLFQQTTQDVLASVNKKITNVVNGAKLSKETTAKEISDFLEQAKSLYGQNFNSILEVQAFLTQQSRVEAQNKQNLQASAQANQLQQREYNNQKKLFDDITKTLRESGLISKTGELTVKSIQNLISRATTAENNQLRLEGYLRSSVAKIAQLENGVEESESNAELLRQSEEELNQAQRELNNLKTISSQQEALKIKADREINDLKQQVRELRSDNQKLRDENQTVLIEGARQTAVTRQAQQDRQELTNLRSQVLTLTTEKTQFLKEIQQLNQKIAASTSTEEVTKLRNDLKTTQRKLEVSETKVVNSQKVLEVILDKLKLRKELSNQLVQKLGRENVLVETTEEVQTALAKVQLLTNQNKTMVDLLEQQFGTSVLKFDKKTFGAYKDILKQKFPSLDFKEIRATLMGSYVPFNEDDNIDFESGVPKIVSGGPVVILESYLSDRAIPLIKSLTKGRDVTEDPIIYAEVAKVLAEMTINAAVTKNAFSNIKTNKTLKPTDVVSANKAQEKLEQLQLLATLGSISDPQAIQNLNNKDFFVNFERAAYDAEIYVRGISDTIYQTEIPFQKVSMIQKIIDDAYGNLTNKSTGVSSIQKFQTLIANNQVEFTYSPTGMKIKIGNKTINTDEISQTLNTLNKRAQDIANKKK